MNTGYALVYSRASVGVKAPEVFVEVNIANGLPGFHLVGLPEKEVKESRDRVRGCIGNTQFEFPSQRITVNLAPGDLPKEGSRYDLPIALGILVASGQLGIENIGEYEFAGELGLSGALRPITGVLPLALGAQDAGRILIIPQQNADEAALVSALTVLPSQHLVEVCEHLKMKTPLQPYQPAKTHVNVAELDLNDVRGQQHAKRGLEIAAAGRHSMLMIGPPGTGKTMLASRLPGLLPEMSEGEALEVAAVHSVAGRKLDCHKWRVRPFRTPHHSASSVAMVGGGRPPRPGEISLAHHGVLFLDELPEYARGVLECLREPLQSGNIVISRAAFQVEFPARLQLIAAMNPCPCGYVGDPDRVCRCSAEQIKRYRGRISGPLLDRIDMHLEVSKVSRQLLLQENNLKAESSEVIRQRVLRARQCQLARSQKTNADLSNKELERFCKLKKPDQSLLEDTMERLKLSARSYHRILKLARTIADLAEQECIAQPHLMEAISLRRLDQVR